MKLSTLKVYEYSNALVKLDEKMHENHPEGSITKNNPSWNLC